MTNALAYYTVMKIYVFKKVLQYMALGNNDNYILPDEWGWGA